MILIFFILFILSAILTIVSNIYSNINNPIINDKILSIVSYALWCITFLYILISGVCNKINQCCQSHLRLSAVFLLFCFFTINFLLKIFENKLNKDKYKNLTKSTYSIPLTGSILFCLAAFYSQFNLITFNVSNIYGMSGSLLLLISSLLSITNNYGTSMGVSTGMLMLIIQSLINLSKYKFNK